MDEAERESSTSELTDKVRQREQLLNLLAERPSQDSDPQETVGKRRSWQDSARDRLDRLSPLEFLEGRFEAIRDGSPTHGEFRKVYLGGTAGSGGVEAAIQEAARRWFDSRLVAGMAPSESD